MGLFTKSIDVREFFSTNFVDIHCHLLPGIDDGAKDIAHATSLIKTMNSFGIHQFRITPHVLGGVWENSSNLIKEKEQVLKNALVAEGMSHIQLQAAAEYMMDENFMRLLQNNDILPLKDNYVLVEMSFFNAPYNLEDILFQIQLKGYTPVLAHPERYAYYHHNLANYEKLINSGCLLQLNLLSLTEQYGKEVKKAAFELLKKNLYTFVGTDTHHGRHLQLFKTLSTKKNQKLLQPLFNNNEKYFSF